jgi:hypothetical protein
MGTVVTHIDIYWFRCDMSENYTRTQTLDIITFKGAEQ